MRLVLHWLHHAVVCDQSSRAWFLRTLSHCSWRSGCQLLRTTWSDIRTSVSAVFCRLRNSILLLQLLHLLVDLCLSLSFIHSLTHKYVHKKHLLLLQVSFCWKFLVTWTYISTLMWRRTCMLSHTFLCSLHRFLIYTLISMLVLFTSFGLIIFICITEITWWSCLSWLVAVVDDESRFVDIEMCRSGWVIQISSIAVFIWYSCINSICWILESLFDLLLTLWIDVVLNLLLITSTCLLSLLVLLLLHYHHIVYIWAWRMSFYFLHLFIFW